MTIHFYLNDQKIATDLPKGLSFLTFLRQNQNLVATKVGCREGDCGACCVLLGTPNSQGISYQSVTSCLFPLVNAHGKHMVTLEGLRSCEWIPNAVAENHASQCGFCTPGFVVSWFAWVSGYGDLDEDGMLEAIDGNICRCTGYQSLKRTGASLLQTLRTENPKRVIAESVKKGLLPEFFNSVPSQLAALRCEPLEGEASLFLGGGTDLLVQKPHVIESASIQSALPWLGKSIHMAGDELVIPGATSVSELMACSELVSICPDWKRAMRLMASTPIRNMATVAGNIANASPIGDLSIMFLAMDAQVILQKDGVQRSLPLRSFFLDYKKMDLREGEQILSLRVPLKRIKAFHFEKVSKRTFLDIASVNSASALIELGDGRFKLDFASGGVAPIPKYLKETSQVLSDQIGQAELHLDSVSEISPISDIRGSAAYKTLLCRNQAISHWQHHFGGA